MTDQPRVLLTMSRKWKRWSQVRQVLTAGKGVTE